MASPASPNVSHILSTNNHQLFHVLKFLWIIKTMPYKRHSLTTTLYLENPNFSILPEAQLTHPHRRSTAPHRQSIVRKVRLTNRMRRNKLLFKCRSLYIYYFCVFKKSLENLKNTCFYVNFWINVYINVEENQWRSQEGRPWSESTIPLNTPLQTVKFALQC